MLIFVWTQFFYSVLAKKISLIIYFSTVAFFLPPQHPPHNGLLLFNAGYWRPITSSIRAGLFSPALVSDSLPPISSMRVRMRIRFRPHARLRRAEFAAVRGSFFNFTGISTHVNTPGPVPRDRASRGGHAGIKISNFTPIGARENRKTSFIKKNIGVKLKIFTDMETTFNSTDIGL